MFFDEYDDILALQTAQTASQAFIQNQQNCHFCRNDAPADTIECPNCGGILIARPPVRQEKNRPKRGVVRVVESANHNGSYTIYKNPDESYSCTCLSFLFQQGVQNGTGFATCKHIRSEVELMQVNASKPSMWQLAALKKLGVKASDSLTNAQAYFLLNDLLIKQGIEYRAYRDMIREHHSVSLLPIYSYGVEFEGGVRNKEELCLKLTQAGLETLITSYGHQLMKEWKITTDATVRVSNTPIELVSPKLFGMEGLGKIEKALSVWNEVGAEVNRSCGAHVHIDAWDWNKDLMIELAKIWAKIEVPVIWHLVSPSRRGGRFCRRLDMNYFQALITTSDIRDVDRYRSLNLAASDRHKTLEFRIHNGTTEAKKITPWIVFVLKLVDAVKKGLRHHQVEATFDGVMEAVGMAETAIPPVWKARCFLYGRFQHWSEHAEKVGTSKAYPNGLPEPFDPATIESELVELQRQDARRRLAHSYDNRRRGLTQRDDNLLPNSLTNLAAMSPSSVVSREAFFFVGQGVYAVPSRDGQRTYQVILNPDDTLTCNCRGFRSHQHCYHTINLARFLVYERELERIEGEVR